MTGSTVSFDFSGHRALVTGATSGIGEAVSRAFVAAGASVLASGRNLARGESLVNELNCDGSQCHFVPGDITRSEFCNSLVTSAVSLMGGLDIVVNSAGVIYNLNAIETSDEQWRETMDVNVNGTFYVCRAALKVMRKSGGVILNIASDAGLSGSSNLCAYNASKGAVVQLSRSLARDFGGDNVRVIPVCPGDVDTPMLRGEFVSRGIDAVSGLQESAESVPLNRVCSAAEVADLVLYAASDSARFMSGCPLVLDAANRA